LSTQMDPQQLQRLFEEQSILDTVPIQIWLLSDSETYGRVNSHHANFMGMKKSDMEFKRLEEFLPKDVAEVCRQSNVEVFKSRNTVHSEEWLTDAGGEKRLISITKTPRFDKSGHYLEYIICYGIDITELRQTEKQLELSRANFRNFIETLNDIVLIGDSEGLIMYSNPAASIKLGYTPEEFKKTRIINLHPVWARSEAESLIAAMFKGEKDLCPLPLLDKNGSIIPVETRAWAGKWNDIECIFGISKDLSKEQETIQKFDRLFRMNPALMALSTLPDQKFTDVNDAFLRTLGYSLDEVLGKTSSELCLFESADEQDRVSRLLAEYGSIREIEISVRTKNGHIRQGILSGDLIQNQGREYFLTVMIDITERKQAEAHREKTIAELQSAIQQIKTLKGIVPICASCKKIRDDKGFWEGVEIYVSKHTDARFSHGLCPDCIKRLYPELSR
jgi:PAS domain S-box-containing protein